MARASIQMNYTLMIWILEHGSEGHRLWVRQHIGQTIRMVILTIWATMSIPLNTKKYFSDEYSIKFG
jgi:hypothetical protein